MKKWGHLYNMKIIFNQWPRKFVQLNMIFEQASGVIPKAAMLQNMLTL